MSLIDNRIIKASFRENPVAERKIFPQSHCLMPISVGQAIHEGPKFEAVIKLINASFKECTVLVDDSVQCHTMAITQNASPESLRINATLEGDLWLQRNEPAINKLTIPFKIMRWDEWYHKLNFKSSLKRVIDEYHRNPDFKQAFHYNIDDFLSRFLNNFTDINVDMDRAFSLCLDYLMEECAVMCLWTEMEYHFEVYPSGRNKAMAATYNFLICADFPQYLRPVALRFKKYPNKDTI